MKEKYSRLTIKNNFLFTKVTSDPALMKQLLQRILPDRTIKYYINCTADDAGEHKELKPFVDYVNGIMSEDPFVLQVDAAVQKAKRNSNWRREFMTMQEEIQYHSSIALEQGRVEGRKEGREEGRILERKRTAGLLMKEGMTFAEACRFLCLSADEIQELQAEMTKQA